MFKKIVKGFLYFFVFLISLNLMVRGCSTVLDSGMFAEETVYDVTLTHPAFVSEMVKLGNYFSKDNTQISLKFYKKILGESPLEFYKLMKEVENPNSLFVEFIKGNKDEAYLIAMVCINAIFNPYYEVGYKEVAMEEAIILYGNGIRSVEELKFLDNFEDLNKFTEATFNSYILCLDSQNMHDGLQESLWNVVQRYF